MSGRLLLRGSALGLALVAAVAAGVSAQTGPPAGGLDFQPVPEPAHTPQPPPAGAGGFLDEIRRLVDHARTGEAVLRCVDTERALGVGDLPRPVAEICARAQAGHGDRLYGIKLLKEAQTHWHEALRLDSRLLDDPAFAPRLAAKGTSAKLAPLTPLPPAPAPAPLAPRTSPLAPPAIRPLVPVRPHTAAPPSESDLLPVPALEGGTPVAPQPPVRPVLAPAPAASPGAPSTPSSGLALTAQAPEPRAPGPRADRYIGAGLGFGYDGLMSVVISWMHDEFLCAEAAVGLIFPTLDARVRIYGVRSALTPVFGLGMLMPFGDGDHYDADIQGGFPELYDHGAAFHLDAGVSWAPATYLDIYGGISFLTTLDGESEMLLFFPHWSVQAIFYL